MSDLTRGTAETYGCAECGELFSEKHLHIGALCPKCGRGRLTGLDGHSGGGSRAVMLAWLLKDAHGRMTGFGTAVGTALGLLVAILVAVLFDTGAMGAMQLIYLTIAGALAGRVWAPELVRLFTGTRATVQMQGDRRNRALILALWLALPLVCTGALWRLGGGGPLAPALKRGVGVLWAKIAGG